MKYEIILEEEEDGRVSAHVLSFCLAAILGVIHAKEQ